MALVLEVKINLSDNGHIQVEDVQVVALDTSILVCVGV